MPMVTLLSDDLKVELKEGDVLSKVCENEDVSILLGCRDAVCGSCLVLVVEGAENLAPKTAREIKLLKTMSGKENERLACQCKVMGDVSVEVSD